MGGPMKFILFLVLFTLPLEIVYAQKMADSVASHGQKKKKKRKHKKSAKSAKNVHRKSHAPEFVKKVDSDGLPKPKEE